MRQLFLKKWSVILGLCYLSCAALSCGQTQKKTQWSDRSMDERMGSILSSDHRSEANKARDKWRHPGQTLKFFEVQPQHAVLEVSPGGGWYSEILAPFVKGHGKLTLAVFADDSKSEYRVKMNRELKARVQDQSDVFGSVQYVVFEPPIIGPLGKEDEYDRILTFRNVHSWLPEEQVEAVFKEFFRVLKPGGIFGVVQHRLPENAKADPVKTRGYVKESLVIELAERAGFSLAAKSEINSNSKDKAFHPKGVWTLPPGFALGDKDKAKYEAIGESDRMTLKFIKP